MLMIPKEIEEKIERKLLGIAITLLLNNREPAIPKGHLFWLIGVHHIPRKEVKEYIRFLEEKGVIKVMQRKVKILYSTEMLKRLYYERLNQRFG